MWNRNVNRAKLFHFICFMNVVIFGLHFCFARYSDHVDGWIIFTSNIDNILILPSIYDKEIKVWILRASLPKIKQIGRYEDILPRDQKPISQDKGGDNGNKCLFTILCKFLFFLFLKQSTQPVLSLFTHKTIKCNKVFVFLRPEVQWRC